MGKLYHNYDIIIRKNKVEKNIFSLPIFFQTKKRVKNQEQYIEEKQWLLN